MLNSLPHHHQISARQSEKNNCLSTTTRFPAPTQSFNLSLFKNVDHEKTRQLFGEIKKELFSRQLCPKFPPPRDFWLQTVVLFKIRFPRGLRPPPQIRELDSVSVEKRRPRCQQKNCDVWRGKNATFGSKNVFWGVRMFFLRRMTVFWEHECDFFGNECLFLGARMQHF